MNRTVSIIGALCFVFLSSLSVSAQRIPLTINRVTPGTLTPEAPVVTYEFRGSSGMFAEALLEFEEERNFDIRFSLQSIVGEDILVSTGNNYPFFHGAYLFSEPVSNVNYRLEVRAENLTAPADFTVLVKMIAGPDPADRILQMNVSRTGTVGPRQNTDTYRVSLRTGVPVLIVVTTPKNILDPVLGVFDPQGNLADVINDFYGPNSILLFTPYMSGTHTLIVQGANFEEDAGPYEIVVKPILLLPAPFQDGDEITTGGDAAAFQVQMDPQKLYSLAAQGVDGFRPYLILTDGLMNVIAQSGAFEDTPAAIIPGFTPLSNEDYFLIVIGETLQSVGAFAIQAQEQEDEADGFKLRHGDIVSGAIGPNNDIDEYIIITEPNKNYSLLATPMWHGLDPMIRVFDMSGKELFSNDDAVNGPFSLLSGIVFPASAEYRVKVSATDEISDIASQTGVYALQFAEGVTFDRGAPVVLEYRTRVLFTSTGIQVTVPPNAVFDDTFPLKAKMLIEKASKEFFFDIVKDETAVVNIPSDPNEVYLLTVSDTAYTQNASIPVVLPPPSVIATVGGYPYAIAVDKQNRIHITDTLAGTVARVQLSGATEAILIGEEAAGGTLGPNALAFDRQGNLYISNGRTHEISRILSNGTKEPVVTEGLSYPVDLAFDADGVLYVAQLQGGVDKILPDGSKQAFVTGIRGPQSLAISPQGQLYVGTQRGEIYKVSANGTPELFANGFADTIHSLAFDQEGYLYAADGNTGEIYRINPQGDILRFARGFSGPMDLAFGQGENSRTLYVTAMGALPFGIYSQQILILHTGRPGVPLPYGSTSVREWTIW